MHAAIQLIKNFSSWYSRCSTTENNSAVKELDTYCIRTVCTYVRTTHQPAILRTYVLWGDYNNRTSAKICTKVVMVDQFRKHSVIYN